MSTNEDGTESPYEYDVDAREVQLAEKLEHLRLSLTFEMICLRENEGLTQADMGERLGIGQPQVSKLENPDIDSSLENIIRYLDVLGAELAVGIRTPSNFIQVSDDTDYEIQCRPSNDGSVGEHDSVVQLAEMSDESEKYESESAAPRNPHADFPAAS
jgi:transcriptional regulator with XRE-family HTH domain